MLNKLNQLSTRESLSLIAGPAGDIEILQAKPRGDDLGITLVICHPHPQMEGTMYNKVVATTARAGEELGCISIRFNFRGVGQSGGEYADGDGEQQDLKAVIDWAKQQFPNNDLWLAGFSFGSFVALSAAAKLPISLLLCIAPPVHYPQFKTIRAPHCPWIVIQGGEDEVVDPTQVQRWVEAQSHQPSFIQLPNAGHFFHGKLIDLKTAITQKLNHHIPKP